MCSEVVALHVPSERERKCGDRSVCRPVEGEQWEDRKRRSGGRRRTFRNGGARRGAKETSKDMHVVGKSSGKTGKRWAARLDGGAETETKEGNLS